MHNSELFSFNSNRLLIYKNEKKSLSYYLPAYVRFHFQEFQQMDLTDLTAKISGTLFVTIRYESNINPYHIEFIQQNVVLLFSHNHAISLGKAAIATKEGNVDPNMDFRHDQDYKTLNWTVRNTFFVAARPEIFWAPFDLVDLILTFSLKSLTIDIKDTEDYERINFKFNLMDHPNTFAKLTYTEEGTFGLYDLAETKMYAQFTNRNKPTSRHKYQLGKFEYQKKRAQQQPDQSSIPFRDLIVGSVERLVDGLVDEDQETVTQKRIENFEFAHYVIPVYKQPLPALIMIFFPVFLLGTINMGIFFQDSFESGKRSQNVGALMVSYVALIPTIRSQVPPASGLIFIEYIVYLQAFTTFFSMLEFIIVRNDPTTNERYTNDWQHQPLLVICIAITALNMFAVTLIYLIHIFIWLPTYNRYPDMEVAESFNPNNWRNHACDMYFSKIQMPHTHPIANRLQLLFDFANQPAND